MALPANYNLYLLLLVLLTLAVPVSADFTVEVLTLSTPEPTPTPVPYTITLFIPESALIHSTHVTDMVNIPNSSGDVLIATSFGLSVYDGTWSTRHMTLGNISEGLMDDFTTAVEYDHNGDLWIGSPKGIQIYNGRYYHVLRDPQLFKDTWIKDLQRWNDDMWVATGHSGIHRYRDGQWTWYQPMTTGGPGFYEADSMAYDHRANATLIATTNEGLWILRSQNDPIIFESIAAIDSEYGLLNHVRRDYRGGVYFFNGSTIVHYAPGINFTPVLTSRDLSISLPYINDLTSAPDGKLYLATDQGIYIWDQDRVYRHLDRFEGIGTSSSVRWISLDSTGRVWFSTSTDAGYYIDQTAPGTPVAVEIVSVVTPAVPASSDTGGFPRAIPTLREDAVQATATTPAGGFSVVTDPLVQAIQSILSSIGLIKV
ncbi:hypothetical protein [Methanoregula sp.]|uniref:hypothetical protein n=1 Tax=Methanoregula sp. TaxID=2052170 RepID=UPI00236D4A4D|nr:hypothetical protein [Methanoregula sp.]MDD1687053.1 hypothetical protein [Methanoregula sp.]